MVRREAPRAPSALHRVVALLVPLLLLSSVLVGSAPQTALASHTTTVPGPSLTAPSPALDDDTTPTWTFSRPADTTETGAPTYDGTDTETVTITHDYDTQCLFGSAPVGAAFSGDTPLCTVDAGTSYAHTEALTADGSYELAARTVETTTKTTVTTYDDGSTSTVTDPPTVRYSAAETQAYVLDTVDPTAAASTSTPPGSTSVTWDVSGTDSSGRSVTLACTLVAPGATTGTGVACAAPSVTTTLSGEGVWTLQVTPTDAAGNVGATVSATYDLQLPPTSPDVTGPTSPGNVSPVTWSFSRPSDATASCALRDPKGVVVTTTPCESPITTALQAGDGVYTMTVTLTDAGGSTSDAASYELDTTGPSEIPTVTARQSGTGQVTPLVWDISTTTGLTNRCRLLVDGVRGADEACGDTYSTVPADGHSYALEAVHLDAVGNHGTWSTAGPAYTYDVTPPAVTITGLLPGATGNDVTPVWTFTAEDGATVTCRVGAPGGTSGAGACSGTGAHTVDLTAEPDGEHELAVTVTDAGGLTTTVRSTYLLDRVAPAAPSVTQAAGGPTSPSRTTTVTWDVTGDSDAVRTECRLDHDGVAGTWAACTSPVSRDLSVEGSYVLRARQYDAATNRTAEGASAVFVIDNTAPAAPVVTGSSGESQVAQARWRLAHGTPAGTRFECRLVTNGVGGAFAPCTDPYDVTFSANGTYRIDVYAFDAAGNRSELTAGPSYRYDTVGPAAPAVSVTPTTGNVTTATWTVVPAGDSVGTECRLVRTAPDGSTQVSFDWRACTSYSFALDTGDGSYALSVRSLDLAGNVGAVGSAAHVLDTTPPAQPVVVGSRTGTDNERDISWTFSGEGTATCRLTRDGTDVGAPVVGCASPYALVLDAVSGTHVLHVTYTDAVGNTSTPGRSADYVLDVTPPATPSVSSDRTGTDNERVVTYAFAGEGTATCQLTADGVPVAAAATCTSPHVVTLPAVDATYVLHVTYTDAVGNTSTPGSSPDYVLDLTPPVVPAVTGPSGTGNVRTATWSFSGEGTATCTLLLDGSPAAPPVVGCTTGHTVTLPSDGLWSLQVVHTDAVGNTSDPGTSPTYLLDTVAPTAPQLAGPTGPSSARLPSWTVGTDTGTTLECRLVRGGTVVRDWAACEGSFSADLTGLPDGGYVLEARATDAATNVSAVAASSPYVLDSTAPAAAVVTGPAGPSQLRTPSFSWTGEGGARAECRLSRDGVVAGDWVSCTSGHAPTLDRDGTWTLAVRLVDAAGNVSAVASSGGYLLDTTAPAQPVVTPPSSPGRDLAPSWGAVVESAAALECRFTGPDGVQDWAACTLPHVTSLDGRPDGPYVLEVRATDAAGNLSAVGGGAYVLDTVGPAAAVVTSPPSPGRTRTPSFSFTTEQGATTRCRLTSGSTLIRDFAPCTSPTALDLTGLADGTYTLTVRVTDAAGNPGPAATGTYVLDTTAPAAPVPVLTPGSPSSVRLLSWGFTAESGSRLECRLTLPGGTVRDVACATSPFSVDLTGLPDGSYSLAVRAVDAAGNAGAATTSVHVLDSTALAAPTVTGPPTPGADRTPTWTVGGAATTDCRLTRGTTVLRDWSPCAGSFTADLFGQPDGPYVLAARARDASGAVSAATSSRYDLDAAAPGAAVLVAPPTPSTNRAPTWSIASPESGVRAECRVLVFSSVLRDWAPCPVSVAGALHTVDLTGLGDGSYSLVVRLTDAAGNRGPEASSTYVLDTRAPVAVGVTGPPSPGNDPTPTWLLSTAGGAALECRLTSAWGVVSDWAPCATEFTADLAGLPDGTYTLSVRAVSAAGTVGPETTSAYVLSTAAPAAPTALTGPASPSRDRAPTWTFTLPSGTTGLCRVVQGTRGVFSGPCSSPFVLDLSGEPDGSYTLSVQAVDAAGNTSSAVTSGYVLDTVATATPTFTSTPGSGGSTLDPQWHFTVARDATGECRLLAGSTPVEDWEACTGSYTALLAGRPDGQYTVQVRAVDSAGNTSPAVSSRYLLARTGVPVAAFASIPVTPSPDRTVSWSLTATDGTLECRLLAPDATTAWRTCATFGPALRVAAVATTGSYALDLAGRPDGAYVLEARVVLADGRRGAAATGTYVLDTVRPAPLPFASVPADAGTAPDPVWLWEAPAEDLVECRLTRGSTAVTAWGACLSPYVADLQRLGEGSYAVELRRVDVAGNASAVTRAAYRYDLTPPPTPVFTTRPPATGADRTVSWTFDIPADATATCTVVRDRTVIRPEAPCTGRYALDLTGMPDGDYLLVVRFTDAAGNPSAPGASGYRLATLAGPVRVDPPSRPQPPVPVDPPTSDDGTAPVPGGRVVIGPVSGGSQGSTSGAGVPILPGEDDVRRPSDRPTTTSAPSQGTTVPKPSGTAGSVLLPGPLPVEDVPEVLRDVVTGTIQRPGLPLALLAVVVLFLLAQNRIDRRDPKLATAPVDAEPELDFTAVVRRPGAAQ